MNLLLLAEEIDNLKNKTPTPEVYSVFVNINGTPYPVKSTSISLPGQYVALEIEFKSQIEEKQFTGYVRKAEYFLVTGHEHKGCYLEMSLECGCKIMRHPSVLVNGIPRRMKCLGKH